MGFKTHDVEFGQAVVVALKRLGVKLDGREEIMKILDIKTDWDMFYRMFK
jgi:hypothetical protein